MEIKTASRSLKNGATLVVPIANNVWVKRNGLGGVKTSVPSGDAGNLTHTIEVPQANDEFPDDGVETGAESPAGDNSNPDIARVEVDLFAGTGAVVGEARKVVGVGDLAENDVGLCEVEAFNLVGVEVWILVEWIGKGLEVRDEVSEVRKLLQVYGFEQFGYV